MNRDLTLFTKYSFLWKQGNYSQMSIKQPSQAVTLNISRWLDTVLQGQYLPRLSIN